MADNGSNESSEETSSSHSYRLIVKQNGVVLSDVTVVCTCDNDGDHTQTLGE